MVRSEIRKTCFLLVVSLFISLHQYGCVFGDICDFMNVESNIGCTIPTVILQEGFDDVSLIYSNGTSAKITINATAEYETYNHTLRVFNNASETYEIILEICSYQNINRLSNLTILFHDNYTSSTQITISNGSVIQASGNFYTLNGLSKVFIKVENLRESQDGESYLYIHLRIRVPNKGIYTLYLITFELT
ncbi:MAG: hypothetical protein QXT10_01525 [Candidatus Bathyarchaeia archaeon]